MLIHFRVTALIYASNFQRRKMCNKLIGIMSTVRWMMMSIANVISYDTALKS